MKIKLITILLLILLTSSVQAFDIHQLVEQVDFHVKTEIKYKFYAGKQDLEQILRRGEGDCTDYATVIIHELEKYNITTRAMHGKVRQIVPKNQTLKGKWERHDWYEYYYNGTWHNIEAKYPIEIRLFGKGYW